MPWDSGTWDGGTWDEPASTYFQPKPKTKQTHMRRQIYYPSRIADQSLWLANFSAKLPTYGTTCGLIAAEVTAAVNDAKWSHYVLDSWLSAVRA